MPLITDSIGRVLGRRYRLVSALGTGSSAHVFLAEDVSLGRRVAVKVLQPALARDAVFLKRFEAEARSVASLNHPHILRVFDWGEDADGPYLVLEYLAGGSLRDLLDRGVLLDQAQAARLGTEVAQGLAYAHARGLVHRDVKPANLLFDEEGRVRVADFGVARALAEAAWTEPAGAMIGTARYASPEQARGLKVDGRSDVYSLALVLYESLTGQVPFTADTAAATLMARVGSYLPRHRALGVLDTVLGIAASPELDDRLDATKLVSGLAVASAALPPPAPLPLRLPLSDGAAQDGTLRDGTVRDGATQDGLVRDGAPEPDGAAVPVGHPTAVAGGPRPFDIDEIDVVAAATWAGGAAGGTLVGGPPGAPPGGSTPPPGTVGGLLWPGGHTARGRRSRWWWVVGAAVVVIAALAGGAVATGYFVASYRVPGLTGRSVASARRLLGGHFDLSVGRPVHSITVRPGAVVRQSPRPGAVVRRGSTISVIPSAGPPLVAVPTLSGQGFGCTAAGKALASAHLKSDCPALLAYSSTVPAGQVINWSYQAKVNVASAPYGSVISVAISKGPPPVAVPTVAHGSYTQAASALSSVGLQATEVQESSTTVPAGQVIGTTPPTGAMATAGSTVKVAVSTGPPVVPVPDVTGDSVAAATAALEHTGLTVGQVYGPTGGQVFTTVPLAGQQVRRGSAIVLYTE